MIARHSITSFLLFLTGLQSTESQPILTCVSLGSASLQLSCYDLANSYIWVKKAYLAVTPNESPTSFCDAPTLDPNRNDCVSSVDDVTNDANTKCALYQNCRLTVDNWPTLLNCTDNYSGFTYLYVEFECLPSQISGVNLPSFIISDPRNPYAQPGISYYRSVGYASTYTSLRGACRLQVPPNSKAIWRLLDLRGRLINLASGCAFLLQIYTRSVYRQWCAELAWTPQQFEIVTSSDAEVINLNFDPIYGQNSEGKVWMNLNVTDSGGNQVNKINITCGKDITLDTPPTTASSATFTSIGTTNTLSLTSTSSTTTTSSTTSPTYIAPTSYPSTTSLLSSSSFAQPSSSVAPTPVVTASFSTYRDASGSTSSATIDTENGTTLEYNGTDPMTTLTPSASSKSDNTVWLIIGLTVGGGLLLLILIIVAIAACGYRKRRTGAQRQGDVIFAWERAETGGATSAGNDDKTPASSAKPKVNTYCRGPPAPAGIYLEISPSNMDSNATGHSTNERPAREEDTPPQGSDYSNITGQPRVNARQANSRTNGDVQINPVYGHLDLGNYIFPIDGVEETIAI